MLERFSYPELEKILTELESRGIEFIIAMESASSLMGHSPSDFLPLTVYVETEIDEIENVRPIVVSDLETIETEDYDGYRVTTILNTFLDIVERDGCWDSALKTLSTYYVQQDCSWGDLDEQVSLRGINPSLIEGFKEDALNDLQH